VARDLVTQAIHAGKHVVTANKALIAEFGNELTSLAERAQVALRFEAAVAGGIPVIKVLRESLAANVVSGMAGIINGTGNFILTEMANAGRSFEDVLAEAQALGYAEADPTFDIDGTDAAHKLVILASLAFGIPLDANAAVTEGIDTVTPEDLDFAKELGFSIKHLGIARRCGDALDLRVHPTLIPTHRQIARVDGVLNAVMIEADAVGEIVLTGPGAGSLPTASSVCGDLMDLGRVLKNSPVDPVPPLGVPSDQLRTLPLIPRHEVEGVWYLRLVVEDRPGVMAEITGLLSARGISIEQLIQRPPVEGSSHVTVVILTDSAVCGHLDSAICDMESLPTLNGSVVRLRVESFKEA
jgi:homoserine dehydrogenase